MSLIVNGTTIGKLIVNGVEVKKLVVNGTEVYKVNETLAKPTQYLLGSLDTVYGQMYDTDSVLDFGLLAYDSNAIASASNDIFASQAYKTFIWDMDSINMFYNTDRAVWALGSQDILYNSDSGYKIPIGFFKPEETETFVTTYDIAMTQTDDGSLPAIDNMYLCSGPALKYILRQRPTLFGIPYENKESVMVSLLDYIASLSSSSNALGIEYIPANLSDELLTDIIQKITIISERIAEEASGRNFITWFIQSPNNESWWENFYQMLTPGLESTFGSNGVWCMPYEALKNKNDWESQFNGLVQDRFDNGAKVMIIPLTTSKCAERQGWVWDTPASIFALELLKNIRSYDNSTGNSFPIANGIIVLDDIDAGIKKQLGSILRAWQDQGAGILSGIFLEPSLNYVIYDIFNNMGHPSCIAVDRFDMSDDILFNESVNMIANTFNSIILSYGLHYLVTCLRSGGQLGTQPLTELIISKEKEKCNATELTDTEFLGRLADLADRLESNGASIVPLYSDGIELLYGKA